MKCKICGFAASDTSMTVCPFCKAQGAVSAPPGGMMPAYVAQTSQAGAAVWPPAPTAPTPIHFEGILDRDALKKQRKGAILMAISPLPILLTVSILGRLLPDPYNGLLALVGIIASLYAHFRGCAQWAESKGYARYEGSVLGLFGWLGLLLLAIRPDKTRMPV